MNTEPCDIDANWSNAWRAATCWKPMQDQLRKECILWLGCQAGPRAKSDNERVADDKALQNNCSPTD